jgi:hypothetical protein
MNEIIHEKIFFFCTISSLHWVIDTILGGTSMTATYFIEERSEKDQYNFLWKKGKKKTRERPSTLAASGKFFSFFFSFF